MSCCLNKISGRELVTRYRSQTITVWVPDTVPAPPPTPPISVTPPSGDVFVPFVGATLIPCLTFDGRQGFRIAEEMADGSTIYKSPCLANG